MPTRELQKYMCVGLYILCCEDLALLRFNFGAYLMLSVMASLSLLPSPLALWTTLLIDQPICLHYSVSPLTLTTTGQFAPLLRRSYHYQ